MSREIEASEGNAAENIWGAWKQGLDIIGNLQYCDKHKKDLQQGRCRESDSALLISIIAGETATVSYGELLNS